MQNHAGLSTLQHLSSLSFLIKGHHDAFAADLRNDAGRLEGFARFVAYHRLQLFVFSRLARSPVRKLLSDQWLNQLKALSLRQWVVQERLLHELNELSILFEGRYEFILLKGPYHAMRFFGSIDGREFSDLDLLIKKEDLGAVEHLLVDRGYSRKSGILFNRALTSRFTHALDFVKEDAAIDLHWQLSANAAHVLDYDSIWQQRQPFVLHNRKFLVLSDEYELVFSLISIFKDLERGAARLKAFVDLYFILLRLGPKLNWPQFLENRKRERLLQISTNMLASCLELFDCAEDFPVVAQEVSRSGRFQKPSSEQMLDLLDASPGTLRNRVWAVRFYDCSRTHVFLWWLVSLPFRLIVHDSDRYTRFKDWLQQT
jgi:Uncharacterised nucleotidyltransferase